MARERTSGAPTPRSDRRRAPALPKGPARPTVRRRSPPTCRTWGVSVATTPSAGGPIPSDRPLAVLEDVLLGGLLLPDGIERHDAVGQQLALMGPHGPLRGRATIACDGRRRDSNQSQAAHEPFPATKNRR